MRVWLWSHRLVRLIFLVLSLFIRWGVLLSLVLRGDQLPGHRWAKRADQLPDHRWTKRADLLPGHRWARRADQLPGHRWTRRADQLPGHRWTRRADQLPGHRWTRDAASCLVVLFDTCWSVVKILTELARWLRRASQILSWWSRWLYIGHQFARAQCSC